MSKKSIDVFADKQYITQIGKEYIHFKFADGSQDRKTASRKEIALVLPWLQSEMNFYDRMWQENKINNRKNLIQVIMSIQKKKWQKQREGNIYPVFL